MEVQTETAKPAGRGVKHISGEYRQPSSMKVKRVAFHTGVQLGCHVTATGLDVDHQLKQFKRNFYMHLMGPGLYIRLGDESWVVPFTNIICLTMIEEA